MRSGKLLVPLIILCGLVTAQTDSIQISEIEVTARISERTSLREPGSAAVITQLDLTSKNIHSLLPALNAEPGVRMEERSPGSYRLSVRGSLLRSPFGVRNLKVYLGEMPLTNAAGETYINLLDQEAVSRIEIHKGPDGSLFGANSGGVIRLRIGELQSSRRVNAGGMAGSFGLLRAAGGVCLGNAGQQLNVYVSQQQSEGYRSHSAMSRKYVHARYRHSYGKQSFVELFTLGTALRYQTPGGLTLAQFTADPRMARPATSTLPGAAEQRAGVYNNTFLAAITNHLRITKTLRHMICVFGSVTDFENPFITNYEFRNEQNAGVRTWIRHQTGDEVRLQTVIGAEMQAHHAGFANFENLRGVAGVLLSRDLYRVSQQTFFSSLTLDIFNRFIVEGSLSGNFNRMSASIPLGPNGEERQLAPQIMPRLAASWFFAKAVSLRALVSRGYSAPTLQELRPSPDAFNKTLDPEHGWNYEAGVRARFRKVFMDLSAFTFRLRSAITRQVDSLGNEFFVNAGSTFQPGVEAKVVWKPVSDHLSRFFGLRLEGSAQLYAFTFTDYTASGRSYSGNFMTGVPQRVLSGHLVLPVMPFLDLLAQVNQVSATPVNDGNTEFVPAYFLATSAVRLRIFNQQRLALTIQAGCDNLLDSHYTPGPDLNAVGMRFYNPAPGRNYFLKIAVVF